MQWSGTQTHAKIIKLYTLCIYFVLKKIMAKDERLSEKWTVGREASWATVKLHRKFHSCPRSFASRPPLHFPDNVSAEGITSDMAASWKRVHLFYNPPVNFSKRTHADHFCIVCGFFCVPLCGIVNQLFNLPVTGFCKKYCFAFHGH